MSMAQSPTIPNAANEYFNPLDYVIFTIMLLIISTTIGIYYAFTGIHKSYEDFVLGDRRLPFAPVAVSIMTSFMSAVTVLGAPAEIYLFGVKYALFAIAYVVVAAITAHVFLPVYHRLRITSAYEYLELRFNKYVRVTGTAMFIIQTLVPYLVLEVWAGFPGIPGLFVAGAYSGTLSTLSSSINALATVAVHDLVKPNFETLSEGDLPSISMGMNLFFGAVCMIMAVAASFLSSLSQAAFTVFGIIGGPLLGIFCLGILLLSANVKGVFSGVICGFVTVLWVGIGSQMYCPPPHRTMLLHLSTAGCYTSNWTMTTTITKPQTPARPPIYDYWYGISYLYLSALGTIITYMVGTVVSLSTGSAIRNLSSSTAGGS